jgi:negative regulator of flagellin synthesis FlgM
MPDPIHGVNAADPLGIISTGQTETAQAGPGAGQAPAAAPIDSADVARAQVLLATISEAANTVPAVNLTRVAELRQAIESGTYRVNPQQIAKMMMEIEDLLAAKGTAG